MKWFNNLKIAKKLIFTFLILSLITAFIGYEGISNMNTINSMLKSLYENETLGISYIKEANINLSDFDKAESNFLNSTNQAERDKYFGEMNDLEKELKEKIEKAKPLVHDTREAELIKQFDDEWSAYKNIVNKVVSIAKTESFADKHQSTQIARNEGQAQSDKIDL